MVTIKRSTCEGEGGTSEEEDGIPTMDRSSSVLPRFSVGNSSWLLIGFAALLIVQHTGVSAFPTPISNITDVKSAFDAPSIVDTPWPARVMARKDTMEQHRRIIVKRHVDYNERRRIISKRSEKTEEEYRKFIDHACRTTTETENTFYAWELDQFSRQLKKKLVPKAKKGVPVSPEDRRTKALITPNIDVEMMTRSLCIPNYIPDDEEKVQEKLNNDLSENEIVNVAFANMYKYTLEHANKDKSKTMDRQPKTKTVRKRSLREYDDDEEFAAKLAKALKR